MTSTLPVKNKSGYLIYCSEVRETIKASNPEIKSVEIVKKMGDGWRTLSDDKKKDYEKKALVDKERFLAEKEAWIANNPEADGLPKKVVKKRTKKAPSAAAEPEPEPEPEVVVVEEHELVQEKAPAAPEAPVAPAPKKKTKKAVAAAPAAPAVEAPVAKAPLVLTVEDKKPKKMNKFQEFCSIEREKLKIEKPDLKPKEVVTELAAMWNALKEKEALAAAAV
jgi:hypothetical protein